MNEFLWPLRVYYEDTDSGGVVYHANYLNFFERARTELLRSHGFEQDELIREKSVIFAVHSVQLEYLLPARFNDTLQVTATMTRIGRASLEFAQRIVREADGAELCTGQVKIASLNAETFRPCAIPKDILQKLQNGE